AATACSRTPSPGSVRSSSGGRVIRSPIRCCGRDATRLFWCARSAAGKDGGPNGRTGDTGMSLPFDATLKDLVQSYPLDWLAALGLSAGGPVTPVNVDLSTVTAAGDVVLAIGDP